jgi:hypothetical protein
VPPHEGDRPLSVHADGAPAPDPAAPLPAGDDGRPSSRRRDGRSGNRCAFDPDSPRLLPPGVDRPEHWLLAEAWDRAPRIFFWRMQRARWRKHFGPLLARLRAYEPDYRWRRAELLEALVLVVRVLIAKLDIRTLQPVVDELLDDDDALGFPLRWLANTACEIRITRIKRVFQALKSAGFELYRNDTKGRRVPRQKRQYVPAKRNGGDIVKARWEAKPAVRLLTPALFRCLELGDQYQSAKNYSDRQWKRNEKARQERARRAAELRHNDASRFPRPWSQPEVAGNLAFAFVNQLDPRPPALGPRIARPGQRLNPDRLEAQIAHAITEERNRLFFKLYRERKEQGIPHDAIWAEVKRLLE